MQEDKYNTEYPLSVVTCAGVAILLRDCAIQALRVVLLQLLHVHVMGVDVSAETGVS